MIKEKIKIRNLLELTKLESKEWKNLTKQEKFLIEENGRLYREWEITTSVNKWCIKITRVEFLAGRHFKWNIDYRGKFKTFIRY